MLHSEPSRETKLSESELIQRLLAGDEAAFRQLVADYQRPMLNLARSIVGEAIADEVVQEAWFAAIRALPKFEQRSSLKTWILRIVSNNAKTRLRKESRMINFANLADDADRYPDESRFGENGHWRRPPQAWRVDRPDEILATAEMQAKLESAIAKLPQAQQSVLMLRDREGLAMEEICKILEVSDSNARVLLHRARARLWQVIEQYEVGP